MRVGIALCLTVLMFLTGCAAPKWQTDTSPDSEVAVIHRTLDPFADLTIVNDEGKGFGFVTQVRLPPGQHVIGFVPHQGMWVLEPTDSTEPGGVFAHALYHYVKFVGERGVVYDVRTTRIARGGGGFSFRIDIVERSTGRIASTPLGNFRKRPVL